MGFLAPLMLVGVAALAVPIAIHLIGRRRARVVKFAALDFLLATKRRTARKFRLRERLLLALRAIACAAVAIALAKPYTSCSRKGPQVTRGPQAVVIVVDDSFASGVVIDGRPWIKTASDEARRILTQLGPEAEVAIVRTAAGSASARRSASSPRCPPAFARPMHRSRSPATRSRSTIAAGSARRCAIRCAS